MICAKERPIIPAPELTDALNSASAMLRPGSAARQDTPATMSDDRFCSLYGDAPCALVTFDTDARVVLASARAELLFGNDSDVRVTAQGVESAAQLSQLRAQGCDFAHGHLFSEPRTADRVLELLLAGGPAPDLGATGAQPDLGAQGA